MIPFAIRLSNNAKAEFAKLPSDVQQRIIYKLTFAQANPFRFFSRLKSRPDYKLRVGDYRVIVDIKQTERIIDVNRIGHRRNVYKD